VANPAQSVHEIWSVRHPMRRMHRGKTLRIILAAEATVVWSTDAWGHVNNADTAHESGLNLWFLDIATRDWTPGTVFSFTLYWKRDQHWQGRNWDVSIL
jgi:glucoamylase